MNKHVREQRGREKVVCKAQRKLKAPQKGALDLTSALYQKGNRKEKNKMGRLCVRVDRVQVRREVCEEKVLEVRLESVQAWNDTE